MVDDTQGGHNIPSAMHECHTCDGLPGTGDGLEAPKDCMPVRLHIWPFSMTSRSSSKLSPAGMGPKRAGSKYPEMPTFADMFLVRVESALLLSCTPDWL